MNEKKAELAAATVAAERDMVEEQYTLQKVNDKYFNMNSRDAQLDSSLNRSGLVRSTGTTSDFSIQYDSTGTRPKIQKTHNCTNKIKSTCAEVSVNCNISNQASRVADQTVCNSFYGHKYYLVKEEAIEKDPSLEELQKESTEPETPSPSQKVQLKVSKSKEKSTVAHTTKEWKAYQHVLQCAKTLNNQPSNMGKRQLLHYI